QSDREMGNKSYGLAWDMDTQLAWAKLRTTVGWDHISDYTRHDHDTWYTELSCTYGDITGRCTRGEFLPVQACFEGVIIYSLGNDNYTLYMADRISWRNVSLMPGVRYD
ncbi:TonB-dependent receptor plug domain-containing protein, partial [Escherichia sp. SS-MK2]